MTKLTTEAKVGAVTILGLILLAFMVIQLGNFNFGEKGYVIKAVFGQVGGLAEGSVVRYAGVDFGKVEKVTVKPDGVEVVLRINQGNKIAEGSKFTIGSDGLLGEKFVSIIPRENNSGQMISGGGILAANSTVRGEEPQGMDQLIQDIQRLVNSVNDILGDEKAKASMRATMINAKEITDRLNEFATVVARMAQNNEQDVNQAVRNLKDIAGNLKDVTGRVDALVANVDNNGQTAKDLRETVANLKTTSERVENMAAALEGIATDPATAKSIKETLSNAREASEKANKMLNKLSGITGQTSMELLYDGHEDKYRANADIKLSTSANSFAVLGVSDIGEKNLANVQLGLGNSHLDSRAGVVDGKAGIGADTQIGNQLHLSVDVYDPNDLRVKLRTLYQIAPDTFVVGESDSRNRQQAQETYFGVRHSF